MNFSRNKGWFIILGILSVILVVLLVDLGISMNKSPNHKDDSDASVTIAPSEGPKELLKNAHPKVNVLVENYFAANADADIDALKQIINPFALEHEQLAKRKSELIENYQNITCYTVDGVDEGTYIVFAYHEIKFKNVETLVPGLETLIVCTDTTGKEYIQPNVDALSAEFQNQIEEISTREDVADLFTETDQKFLEAYNNDEKVRTICEQMGFNVESILPAETEEPEATTAPAASTDPNATQDPNATTAPSASPAASATPAPTKKPTTLEQPSTEVGAVNRDMVAIMDSYVYSDPSKDSNQLGMVAVGKTVTVLENVNGTFCKVKRGDTEGYMEISQIANFVEDGGEVSGKANYYSSCSSSAVVLGTMEEGTKYICNYNYSNGWSQVLVNGQNVYVKTSELN